MAKKQKEVESEEIMSDKDQDKAIDKALLDLSDINPEATFLNVESLSNVTDWIDTGCYALNAIISGSVYRGIAGGRISGIAGLSQTGKTLITNKIMANAINMGYKAIYFDSEHALDGQVAYNLGCDITKIRHMPVECIEDCKQQIITILTKIIETKAKKKVIMFIDSLGGLKTRKEIADALEGSSATDMGSRAKHIASLINIANSRCASAGVPLVYTNHIYENPGQMYPTMVKTQSGGLKHLYMSSLLLQLSTTQEKIEKSKQVFASKLSTHASGVNLRALTIKNRFVVPFLETTMELNYKTGLNKYSGLLDIAIAYGIIERNGARCSMDGESLGYASSFEDDPKFWDGKVLDRIDVELKKDLCYSNANDKLVEEVKQL